MIIAGIISIEKDKKIRKDKNQENEALGKHSGKRNTLQKEKQET